MASGDPISTVVDRLPDHGTATTVVAVAGPVAVGKSTLAADLADRWRRRGRSVAVVATDGFLWPNAVLEAKGLLARKGFPESYDLDRLDRLLADARAGRSPLAVPVYSHDLYDVLPDATPVDRPEVLVVEGVVALQRPFADLAVYLDAEEAHVRSWYVARFQGLVEAARRDPTSFYGAWADLGPDEVAEVATAVWDAVNGPNLRDHIAPTKRHADVVVRKGADHRLLSADGQGA